MRYFLASLGVAALITLGICAQNPSTNTPPSPVSNSNSTNQIAVTKDKPAPKKEAKPLLLLDDAADAVTAEGADNSRCQVCHINFMKEELTRTHARAGIGCAKCHGICDDHIADESWASGGNGTAPDTMFPKAKINVFCLGCHPKDKIDADQHKDVLAGTGDKKYCTDCHGKHRMVTRKCKWK